MNELTATLSDLIQLSRDGWDFYRDASSKVKDPEVKRTIDEMARIRAQLVQDFSGILKQYGEDSPSSGTLVGTMRKLYADSLATFSSDRDKVYVAQLEEAEDRLLHTFEDALLSVESPTVRTILKRYLPLAKNAHARMSELKHRTLKS